MSDDDELLEERRAAARNDGERSGKALRLGEHVAGEGRVVPCRECGAGVEVSPWVLEIARQLSEGVLRRRGERPIEDGELTMCRPCAVVWEQRKGNTAMRLAEQVGIVIRQVKDGRDLNQEQFDWLRRNGYSDTADGMETIMRRRRDGADKGRARGGQ